MSMAIFGDEISFQIANMRPKADNRGSGGCALQNSDINRAELGALLRRQDKDGARGGRNFWQGFMAAQAASCANSNG